MISLSYRKHENWVILTSSRVIIFSRVRLPIKKLVLDKLKNLAIFSRLESKVNLFIEYAVPRVLQYAYVFQQTTSREKVTFKLRRKNQHAGLWIWR